MLCKPKSAQSTPLPWKKMIPVMVLLFCEAFNGNTIFTYAGYMVLDLGVASDKSTVGYWVGLIASIWFLAQFASSFFWGRMSDKYGRRPVMIFGVFGSVVSSIAFGFSYTLWFAIFARALNGILNGNIGVIKTYIGEITNSSNQAKAFGIIGLMWGFGSVTGSMIGGFTPRPAINHPDLFDANGIFGKFPYLLPNLITAAFSFIGFILTLIFLKENPSFYSVVSEVELSEADSDADIYNMLEDMIDEKRLLPNAAEEEEVSNQFSIEVLSEKELRDERAIAGYSDNNTPNTNDELPVVQLDKIEKSLDSPVLSKPRKVDAPRKPSSRRIDLRVLKERNVVLACSMYAIIGFYYTMLDETVPLLFMAEVKDGGLGFSLKDIGIVSGIVGGNVILIQMVVYHNVVGKLKLIRTFQLGSILAVPMIFSYPLCSFVNAFGSSTILWATLVPICVLRAFASQCAFSSVMALINNSTDYSNMGSVNGLGQSLVALMRAIGPAFSATVFAWSLEHSTRFLIFIMASVCCLIPLVMSFYLTPSMNKPKNESTEEIEMTVDI